MGEEACTALCEALQQESPVSIRLNPLKSLHSCEDKLCGLVPRRLLPVRTSRPLRLIRCFMPESAVQEAASDRSGSGDAPVCRPSVGHARPVCFPEKVPLAAAACRREACSVSNKVMRNRSQVLAENLVKWGKPAGIVTSNDPAGFTRLGPVFDVILTDVPCSGEGMFRKDPVAVEEWSVDDVRVYAGSYVSSAFCVTSGLFLTSRAVC